MRRYKICVSAELDHNCIPPKWVEHIVTCEGNDVKFFEGTLIIMQRSENQRHEYRSHVFKTFLWYMDMGTVK